MTSSEFFDVEIPFPDFLQYADILYGPENPDNEAASSENEEDESIEEALSKEIKELKNEKLKERRFQVVKDKVKNVVFIKTNIKDPNELAELIFTDLEKTKISKTRYICYFDFFAFCDCVQTILAQFENDKKCDRQASHSHENEISFADKV